MSDLSDYQQDLEYEQGSLDRKKVFKIMRAVANLKVTYVSELISYTGIERDELKRILYELHDNNLLERLNPRLKGSDDRLLSRVAYFNTRGISGINQFRNMNWYALNSERDWFLSVEGRDLVVDEYHNLVDMDEYRSSKVKELYELASEKLELI